MKKIIFGIALTFLFSSAQAEDKKPKRTTINFEDQLIKGQSQKPDLIYMLQKKDFNYKRLIRLRENFIPEMRNSANEIESSNVKKSKKRGSD